MKISPLKKRVLVKSCEIGARQTVSGIHLLDDDGQEKGIRPRWFQVKAIGPEQEEVEPGDYILVAPADGSIPLSQMQKQPNH